MLPWDAKKRKKRVRISGNLALSFRRVHPARTNSSLSLKSCDYNANSRWQRYWLTMKIIAVSLFSVLVLLVFISMDVHEALGFVEQETEIKDVVDGSIKVAELIHCLQVERGLTVLTISSNQNNSTVAILDKARLNTSKAILNIRTWSGDAIFSSEAAFTRTIQHHRDAIDYGRNSTVRKEIEFYTNIINLSLDWLFDSYMKNTPNKRLFDLLGYQMFLVAKDKTGIERALGGSFFARGHFNETQDLLWYAEQKIIGNAFLETSIKLMPILGDRYDGLVNQQKSVINELHTARKTIMMNTPAPGNGTAGQHWFSLITKYINILLQVQKSMGEHVSEDIKKDVESKQTKLAVNCIILALVIVMTPLMIMAVIKMTNTIQKYAARLEFTTQNLKEEQKRTDAVLSAMFPLSVAETLKKGEKVNSEYFDSVTVFFSDIVNFTNICSMISPMDVTTMLNAIYSCFDDTIDKYDVYKVETIGDAYMVVSGLPIRNGNSHVDQICRMAFDLVQVTHDFELVEVPGEVLLIRVGIHTGPCVSGIVGLKMPRYCLFGDTVNTASRMQTTGLPQKIHISETTLEVLNYFDGYETEHRGQVDVKGKGLMQTYWLHNFKRSTEHEQSDRIQDIAGEEEKSS